METRCRKKASFAAAATRKDAIIDLTLSDDESGDRKPAAAGSTSSRSNVNDATIDLVDLVSDDDEDEDFVNQPFARKQQQDQEAKRKQQEDQDAKLATRLVSREDSKSKRRIQNELSALQDTPVGRSILLVEAVISLLQPFGAKGIEPVGKDDAVILSERLLECQQKFKAQNKPTQVVIGYHFTPAQNLEAIQTDGLLTIEDRVAAKNKNTRRYAFFVDGIYTGTNPTAFTKYGGCGLMVAILKGNEHNVGKKSRPTVASTIDTVIGNKTGDAPYEDEVILRNSCQVLPLVKFNRQQVLADDVAFDDALWSVHKKVQRLLDKHVNSLALTPMVRVKSKVAFAQKGASTQPTLSVLHPNITRPPTARGELKKAPPASVTAAPKPQKKHSSQPKVFGYGMFTAPNGLTTIKETPFSEVLGASFTPEECTICLDNMVCKVVKLNVCTHQFHKACLEQVLSSNNGPRCPICRRSTKEPRGQCPSGYMAVTTTTQECVGVIAGLGTLCIQYRIYDGAQKSYHANPGGLFKGLSHISYVPNNQAGRDLVKRMAYAFNRGLSFQVFAAPSNTVAVASAPTYITGTPFKGHRSSVNANLQSWVDPHYFQVCNQELDAVAAPPACALEFPGGYTCV